MDFISETFPRPPISKTKVPLGFRACWTPQKKASRVDSGRRIQCMAALEKTLSYLEVWDAPFSTRDVALRTIK